MQVFSTPFYDYIALVTDLFKIRDLLTLAIFKPGKAIFIHAALLFLPNYLINVYRFQDFSKKFFDFIMLPTGKLRSY